MDILNHAKTVAANIIANQNGTMPQSVDIKNISIPVRKKTKTVGPDTQIKVAVGQPAVIISEDNSGGIEEFVVISPNSGFSIYIESNDNNVKLDKTWAELSAVGAQAHDISAFTAADGKYVLNVKNYRWQKDMLLMLRSTGDSILFDQVYANWYIYGEE